MVDQERSVELPIQDCDIKITVGRDGVWLHLGKYTGFHVANSLGQGSSIISSQLSKWIVERQEQAKGIK